MIHVNESNESNKHHPEQPINESNESNIYKNTILNNPFTMLYHPQTAMLSSTTASYRPPYILLTPSGAHPSLQIWPVTTTNIPFTGALDGYHLSLLYYKKAYGHNLGVCLCYIYCMYRALAECCASEFL